MNGTLKAIPIMLSCILCLQQPLLGAKLPDPPLQQDWYKTSIIIFSRLNVSSSNSAELLFRDTARSYPKQVLAFPFDAQRLDYFNPLSAMTLNTLTWPTLAMLDPIINQIPPPPLEFGEVLAQLAPNDIPLGMAIAPEPEQEAEQRAEQESEDAVEQAATATGELVDNTYQAPDLPSAMELALQAFTEHETQLTQQSLQALPENAHLLHSELRRLQRRDDFQVLYSASWIQAVPDRQHPLPLLIQAGTKEQELFNLEGTIAITLGRYLHAAVDLWLHDFADEPVDLPVPESELMSESTEPNADMQVAPDTLLITTLQEDSLQLFPESPLNPLPATVAKPEPAAQWMQLNESRRMRSDELHYLDHPKFGILIKIDPVEIPETLKALWVEANNTED